MLVTPAAPPVTIPLPPVTVAVAGLAVDHVPEGVTSVITTVPPAAQTVDGPTILAGSGKTTNGVVILQPVTGNV